MTNEQLFGLIVLIVGVIGSPLVIGKTVLDWLMGFTLALAGAILIVSYSKPAEASRTNI